jgi:hypothetical protein
LFDSCIMAQMKGAAGSKGGKAGAKAGTKKGGMKK